MELNARIMVETFVKYAWGIAQKENIADQYIWKQ
jgi:hypothetical protein